MQGPCGNWGQGKRDLRELIEAMSMQESQNCRQLYSRIHLQSETIDVPSPKPRTTAKNTRGIDLYIDLYIVFLGNLRHLLRILPTFCPSLKSRLSPSPQGNL